MKINEIDLYLYIYKLLGVSPYIMMKLCKLNEDFTILHKKNSEDIYLILEDSEAAKVVEAKDKVSKNLNSLISDAKIHFEEVLQKEIKWTHILRDDYPRKLLNIVDPPTFLYYKGHLPFEFLPVVSVIGARECSEYGEQTARKLATELAERGVQIVSGMARGIDGIAQNSAIEAKGNTYAILGSGPDIIYPRENNWLYWKIAAHGGIISEYVPGTKPEKFRFPARNRIISGIADIVLVVEARKKSGTFITVTQALEQGKEVFAVPGRINDALSEGCNELLFSGAGVAYNSSVIIDSLLAMGYTLETDFEANTYKKKNCYRNERISQKIIEALKDNPKTPDELLEALERKISLEELYEVLTDMQIDGAVEKRGGRYCLIKW